MKNIKPSLVLTQFYPELDNLEFVVLGNLDRGEVNFCDSDLTQKTGYLYALKEGLVYELSLTKEHYNLIFDLREYYGREDLPKVVDFSYNYITNSLVLAIEDGDLLVYYFDQDAKNFCCACNVELGLRALEWSPDQENLVLSVGDDNCLLVMSSSFCVLNEIFLEESSEGEQKLMSVGWGRKETQFHGSEGKKAATAPLPDLSALSVADSCGLTVTWRGDSALFAVGYMCTQSKARRIKIFSKEGALQCASEDLPGLEEPMAWRPSGNLIGLVQSLPSKYVIAFMEKNGLKHGEFIIPQNIKVDKLIWNADSSILGILASDKTSGEESLMLWTTGNYHWYLKQKIVLESTPVRIFWDDIRENRLHIVFRNGTFFSIEWTWWINNTSGHSPNDLAYVAVIDHDKILLTSFKEAVIPPPMCGWSLDCPSAVNQVLFLQGDDSDCQSDAPPICALMHNDEIAFFSKSNNNFVFDEKIKIPWPREKNFPLPVSLSHWLWLSRRTFLLCTTIGNQHSAICVLDLTEKSLTVRNILKTDGVFISCHSFGKQVILQKSNGKLCSYDIENHLVLPHEIMLKEPCFKVNFNEHGIFSLSELGRLYLDGVHISSNVTSFLFHKPYLIATTTQHTLIVVNPNTGEEISLRKLERGSKLVVACGNSVVMQLPRGNLETIQPRALTVLTVGQLLDGKKYNDAMTLLRRQRIDLNLCVDHNCQQFIADVGVFVSQVDPQWITLLITELSPTVVTKDAYSSYYNQKIDDKQQKMDKSKVETVCSALYDEMMVADKDYFLLPILSCLVKTKKMKKAIELCTSDEALKHLLFLVDVDKLYAEALGAYNLEIALRIVGKSQKDPKEYLPFLNSLRLMEPNYMKYTIDKSLGRLESALYHIAQCQGNDKEQLCNQLVVENSLYREALEIFVNDSERLKEILELYGDHLHKCKHYEEAGIMYTRCKKYEEAIQAFLAIGEWKQCMVLANKLNYDEKGLKKLAVMICNKLYARQEYADAAYVYRVHLSDIERSVESYTKGKKWQEAIYTAESNGASELKESVIKKSLMGSLEMFKEDIKSRIEKIQKYVNRLTIVRADKLKQNSVNYIDDIGDTQSETSSVLSMRSSSTSMSRMSKNSRKMQRKMWSLKEGNPREEQALVATLSQLIQSSEKLTGEVRSTCLTLLYFNEDNEAQFLQSEVKTLLQLIESSKPSIWLKDNEDTQDVLDEQLKFAPPSNIQQGWELEILKKGK